MSLKCLDSDSQCASGVVWNGRLHVPVLGGTSAWVNTQTRLLFLAGPRLAHMRYLPQKTAAYGFSWLALNLLEI